MRARLGRVRSRLRYLGPLPTALRSVYMAANELMVLRIYECLKLTLEDVTPESRSRPSAYRSRFLSRPELERLSGDPANRLSRGFLESAWAKGDECLAFLDGEALASFGWYSRRPKVILGLLRLHFDPAWMYMYRGYTKPAYRGQRLHSMGLLEAVRVYTERGRKGLVSIVEAVNFESKRSVYRMGWQKFGVVYHLGLGRRSLVWHTGRCDQYDFFFEKLGRSGRTGGSGA